MARLHFTRCDAIDANDVIPERALENRTQLTGRQRPDPPLELEHEVATAMPTQITAELFRGRVHRLPLREQGEVTTALDLGEDRLRFRACDVLRRLRRLGSDDDLTEGHRRRLVGE